MQIKYFILIIFALITTLHVCGQDPHFSQYQASPLTINPAMTGLMNQDFRLTMNYRTQYWAVGGNFNTGTISFENKIQNNKDDASGKLAWGILGLYDVSGNGGYKNVNIAFSGSYGKFLDYAQSQTLTIGFQAALSSRSMNINGLSFANQFTSNGFDLSLPNNESILNSRKTYGDFNAGLVYSFNTETQFFYSGISMYHINRPKINFDKDEPYKLPSRLVIHSGYRFIINDQNAYVLLNTNYMKQGSADNMLAGAAVGFPLGSYDEEKHASISGGLWYRHRDALIPYIGLDWKNYQLGLTYDILNSAIKQVSPKTGSFEISLRFAASKELNPFSNIIIGREY